MRRLDLNLDAGEDLGALREGSEAKLYRLVTRVNIACGGHAGDADTMKLALRLAKEARILVGAHPSCSLANVPGYWKSMITTGHV